MYVFTDAEFTEEHELIPKPL
jgi:TatD DNase family protein